MNEKLTGFELEQNGQKFYVTFMSARQLVDKSQTDVFDPRTKKGYQRRINEARAKAFADYLTIEHQISPTAIVISYRDSEPVFKKLQGNYGEIVIPKNQVFWQVDGQHRIAGMKRLIDSFPPSEEADELRKFLFPVVIICPGLWARGDSISLGKHSKFEEAKQFLIINRTQKGVPTDLTEQFLQKIKDEYGGIYGVSKENLPKEVIRGIDWKPEAIAIAEYLNANSPIWINKIQMANQEPRSGAFVNQKAFTDSLEPVLKSDLRDVPAVTIQKMLDYYWQAVRELCPEAYTEYTAYVLYRRTGVFVINNLFKTIALHYLPTNEEISKNSFVKILKVIPQMNSMEWSVNSEWGNM